MFIDLHVKYLLYMSDFNEAWILPTDYGKIARHEYMKIRWVGADGRTDRNIHITKLVAFINFANAPKNQL